MKKITQITIKKNTLNFKSRTNHRQDRDVYSINSTEAGATKNTKRAAQFCTHQGVDHAHAKLRC